MHFFFYFPLLSDQVLYVPRHWWHYVESVDPVTVSVNSWIELVSLRQCTAASALSRSGCQQPTSSHCEAESESDSRFSFGLFSLLTLLYEEKNLSEASSLSVA